MLKFLSKRAIIDKHHVWYGNIGLLSYWGSEESIMRLESRELAEELINLLE